MKTEIIDVGDHVECDNCGKIFTDSVAEGGFVFGSNGICPECAPSYLESIKKYKEERYIKARAQPGETFKNFILRVRGGDNTVRITEY